MRTPATASLVLSSQCLRPTQQMKNDEAKAPSSASVAVSVTLPHTPAIECVGAAAKVLMRMKERNGLLTSAAVDVARP